jgi:hypothetical protein
MWQLTLGVWDWFRTHEWFAIWLEGIALVAIFIWDRKDARSQHKETLSQIAIAKRQAEAAMLTAQSLVNSERAWLTAHLGWLGDKGRIVFSETKVGSGEPAVSTNVELTLTLRNDGKTPAWIETICVGMEISGSQKSSELPIKEYIEPLGAGKDRAIQLSVSCSGKPKMMADQQLLLHLKVNFRDIFDDCQMALEFSINPLTEAISRFEKVRLDAITQRNV